MKKRLLKSALIIGLGIGLVMPAQATFAVWDAGRGMQFLLQSVERSSEYSSMMSKNNNLQQQIKIWTNKTSIAPPASFTYEYATKVSGAALPSSEIAPPQKTWDEAVAFVEKTFFVPAEKKDKDDKKSEDQEESDKKDTDNVTEQMLETVRNRRKAYVINLGKEIISYASGIRTSTAQELEALKESSSSAGGILQEIDLNSHTLKSLVLITAANVFLEAQLLEMEAAGMMLGKGERLLPDPNANGGKK